MTIGPLPLVRDNPVPRMPVVFLWPHSNCNCRCVMCDIWLNRSRDEIAAAEIARWSADWQELGVRHVVLTGGEPLMHSHFWDLCAALRSAGMVITLLSTGVTLFRVAERVAEFCSGVRFSLDGPPTIHDEIRRIPGAYERLARSARALKDLDPRYPVFGRSAIHRQNYRSFAAIVDTAHELGFDRVSFLATDVTSDAFNRPKAMPENRSVDLLLAPEEVDQLEEQIGELERTHARDFESGFINETASELRARLVEYYRAMLGAGPFHENVCNTPWISALVQYDGTVKPCFFQPAYGNIRTDGSLSAIVNSPHAVAFRETLDVATNPICQRCVCTFAIRRCQCRWSHSPPFCDNSCLLADFLAWDDGPRTADQASAR